MIDFQEFKEWVRGDTLTATMEFIPEETLPNLIGCTVTSMIMDSGNNRWAATCTVADDGLSAVITFDATTTAKMALGTARWDVRVANGDVVKHTNKVTFTVTEQITNA